MERKSHISFVRYDVLYGVTHSESFHLLNAATLQFGITETERNRIIRTYVRNNYAHNIDQVTAAILNAYTVCLIQLRFNK